MSEQIDVGLAGDQIMQRYLVRRIFHEFELRVVEVDGITAHVGFITGFDDRCLQLSTTPAHDQDEPKAILIYWPIRRIEETGSRIDCLAPDHRKKIRSYSHALRAQCEAVLNKGGPTNNNVSPIGRSPQPRFSSL